MVVVIYSEYHVHTPQFQMVESDVFFKKETEKLQKKMWRKSFNCKVQRKLTGEVILRGLRQK